MELALAVVGAAVLVFWPLVVCGALLLRLAGLLRRRGGASRPVALRLVSPTAKYTTGPILPSVASSSSAMPLGGRWGGEVTRPTLLPDNSRTAHGYCGAYAGAGRSPGQRQGLAG